MSLLLRGGKLISVLALWTCRNAIKKAPKKWPLTEIADAKMVLSVLMRKAILLNDFILYLSC